MDVLCYLPICVFGRCPMAQATILPDPSRLHLLGLRGCLRRVYDWVQAARR